MEALFWQVQGDVDVAVGFRLRKVVVLRSCGTGSSELSLGRWRQAVVDSHRDDRGDPPGKKPECCEGQDRRAVQSRFHSFPLYWCNHLFRTNPFVDAGLLPYVDKRQQ